MQVGSESCLSARLAIYEDGQPEPRVEEVQGTGPQELIHRLCTDLEGVILAQGGGIPQPGVRALVENLIHADFRSVSISVLDHGHTLRVADQGPGITDKERALLPGFSTADPGQRRVIKGVGSGLGIAAGIASAAGGRLEVADNLRCGTVVTLSLGQAPRSQPLPSTHLPLPQVLARGQLRESLEPRPTELSDHGKRVLLLIAELGGAVVPTICDELRISSPVAAAELDALSRLGLLDPVRDGRFALTPAGLRYLDGIFVE